MGTMKFRPGVWSIMLATAFYGAGAGMHSGVLADDVAVQSEASDMISGAVRPSDVASPAGSSELSSEQGTSGDLSLRTSTGTSLGRTHPTEQNTARAAVERGDALPYGWLMKRIKKAVPGDIVRVRLRRGTNELWTYDVTVLSEAGRFVQVSLDAATGDIISRRNR